MPGLLHDSAVIGAAHALYSDAYAREIEERGLFREVFGLGCRIDLAVNRLPDEVLLPIGMRYVGRIEGIWGQDLGMVFHHMGLTDPDAQESALWRLLAGCQGHGISLADDHAEAFDRAVSILWRHRSDLPDINPGGSWEMPEFRELAESQVDSDYPESVPAEV